MWQHSHPRLSLLWTNLTTCFGMSHSLPFLSSLPGESHTETNDASDGQCSSATYYCHANQAL